MKFSKSSLIGALCAAGILGSTATLASDSATVAVSATVTGVCKFNSGGSVAFTLDPSVGGTVNGTVTQPAFWCTKGAAYTLSDNKGVNGGGTATKMKHATLPDLIPYSFSYTTTGSGSGAGTPISMNIAASVLQADYINASAGSYADTVTLSITP